MECTVPREPLEQIPELMQDADLTILCAYRKQVSQYNEAALLAKFNMPLIHAVHPAGSAANCPELSDWFNDSRANMLPLVAAKVMVLSNINVVTPNESCSQLTEMPSSPGICGIYTL